MSCTGVHIVQSPLQPRSHPTQFTYCIPVSFKYSHGEVGEWGSSMKSINVSVSALFFVLYSAASNLCAYTLLEHTTIAVDEPLYPAVLFTDLSSAPKQPSRRQSMHPRYRRTRVGRRAPDGRWTGRSSGVDRFSFARGVVGCAEEARVGCVAPKRGWRSEGSLTPRAWDE